MKIVDTYNVTEAWVAVKAHFFGSADNCASVHESNRYGALSYKQQVVLFNVFSHSKTAHLKVVSFRMLRTTNDLQAICPEEWFPSIDLKDVLPCAYSPRAQVESLIPRIFTRCTKAIFTPLGLRGVKIPILRHWAYL